LKQKIMERVDTRREAMIAAGEEVTQLRKEDQPVSQPGQPRRVPPHLAGPTAMLSDDLQAKDFDSEQPSQQTPEDRP
jgi:GTP-binding protein